MSEKLKVLEYEMRKVEFEEECEQHQQLEKQLEFIYGDETEESAEYGYN